ncbi:hypothetical protein [Nonomuraea sp. NPDC049784]
MPQSWLVWPIGALKTLGVLGLLGMPLIGTGAAAGLVLSDPALSLTVTR